METCRYRAFISYRHQSPDMEIAKRLHTMIETYRVPGSIARRSGMKRLGKVFRDSEELPLSANLGEDIETALEESQWFIAICSPRYLESRWCMRELEYFIARHGRDRVLAVLAEGEPADSFPDLLRFRTGEDGTVEEVEPLAADARGATLAQSLKKLDREKLRVLAPLLGVGFDDLYQRQRRRRTTYALAATSAALVLVGGFLAYALVQNVRIETQRVLAAQNQCDLLIEKSLSRTAENKRLEASALALSAYDVSHTIDDYAADQIRDALSSACYQGDFTPAATLTLPGVRGDLFSFSPDDRRVAAVVSQSSPACYDAETGERLWIASPMNQRTTTLRWSADGRFLAAASQYGSQVRVYAAADGGLIGETEVPFAADAVFAGDKVVLCWQDGLTLWDPVSDTRQAILEPGVDAQHALVTLSPDGTHLAFLTSPFDATLYYLDLADLTLISFPLEGMTVVSGFAFSPDGGALYIRRYNTLSVVELATGAERWRVELEEGTYSGENLAVWADCGILDNGALYDPATGEKKFDLESRFYRLSADGRYLICADGFYRVADGSLFCSLPGTFLAADHAGRHILIAPEEGNADKVCVPGGGSQYRIDRYEGALTDIPIWSPLQTQGEEMPMLYDDYNDVRDASLPAPYRMSQMCVSPDGRFVVLINDGSYVKLWDLEKGEKIAFRIYEFTSGGAVSVAGVAFSADSSLVALAGDLGNVAVYELSTGKMVQSWNDHYLVRALGGVKFDASGDLIMVSDFSSTQFTIYSVSNGLALYTMHADGAVTAWGFDEATGDGVLVYEDGSAQAADIFTSPEELYAYAGAGL